MFFSKQLLRVSAARVRRQLAAQNGAKYFSSLSNPMFPQREAPPIPSEFSPEMIEKNKNKKAEDDDFLSRHGGKVAFSVFGLIAYLIYSMIKGGTLQKEQEEMIASEYVIDPHEINELRLFNNITKDDYHKINEAILDKPKMTYSEFVDCCSKIVKIDLGHYLDQVVYSSVQSFDSNSEISTQFLLSLLLLVVREEDTERAELLFNNYSKQLVAEENESITLFDAESAIESLVLTFQIPPNKLVKETGVKYPWRTYRRKEISEMVLPPVKGDKWKHADRLSKEEFKKLILGGHVCAWGACYGGN